MPKSRDSRKQERADIEYRERISALPEELKRTGVDPFAVDVPHILEELKKEHSRNSPDLLTADARALNSVSEVVQIQDQWIGRQLSTLQVDPALVEGKVKQLSLRSLAYVLFMSHHPPVGVRQVSTKRLLEAADYWIQLQGWGRKPGLPANQPAEQASLQTLEFSAEDIEKEVTRTSEYVLQLVSEGPVPYERVLGDLRGEERIKRSYIISLICAQGLVTLRYDPTLGSYVVQKAVGPPDSSVAIKV